MDQDDGEKHIADVEHELAGQRRGADLRPTHHDAEIALPAQTIRVDRRRLGTIMFVALTVGFVVGLIMIVVGLNREDDAAPRVVWLGVASTVLSLLIFVTRARAGYKRDLALREPGLVELLTVASTYRKGHQTFEPSYWELTSEIQIRLDSGPTFGGSYCASMRDDRLRRTRPYYTPDGVEHAGPRPAGRLLPHFDEWFRVGASLRCLYNPANPDKVVVFPSAAPGDRVKYNEFLNAGKDYVWFHSAT